jgi:protocatechuate 3,4-dioxygenase beta subunit
MKRNDIVRLVIAVGFLIGNNTRAPADETRAKPYPSTLHGGAPCGSCAAPEKLSSTTTIAPESEPGERMEISGTLYRADGKTPAKDVVLFVYHTDAKGYYNAQDDASHPRLRGWMQTGADGRYLFRSIKPAPYPHRTTPAHIHAHIYSSHISEHSIDDYWFAGDPFITKESLAKARANGSTPAILTLTRGADGVWKGTRDIRLRAPDE